MGVFRREGDAPEITYKELPAPQPPRIGYVHPPVDAEDEEGEDEDED